MKKLQVINSNGEKEPYKPRKISKQIIEETQCSEELAQKIQNRVSTKLYKLGLDEINTRQIRAEVSSQLLKEGMVSDAENTLKMGMTVTQIEDLLSNHSTENANNNDNSESFYKRVAEKTLEEYTFAKLPTEISKAHTGGYIHIHDRGDFFIKPNCFSYEIPWLLRNGFSPDGDRKLGATSSPPKHFDTLVNLMHELLGCGKIDLSGGQNFPHTNVYLSPCTVDLSYDELKQNLQSLLFNLNQAIMSKGEVVFSSMGWDLEVPSYMKDEDAIGLGGAVVGKYGDYEDEAKRILKIWCELQQDGDSRGVPFRFPNNIFVLRDDYENSIDEQLYWICEYLCKFPTGYFSNDDLPNTGGISTIMGCRTRNTNADKRFSWKDNTINNGNLAFHTLNLPLFALESENLDEFYELLEKYCNIALDGLCLRREVIEDRLANDKLPFLMWKDKQTGRTLYEVERTTLSVGYVGLDETVKELTNNQEDITTEKGRQLGIDIINHIQKLVDIRKEQTGYKIGVFSTPAESTAHRFAKLNKEKYPKAIVNGKGNDIFYTNSHHIQVSNDVLLTDHLRNAETFHKLTPFGAICHVFLGTKPTVESLVKLTKLIKKHDIGFWSYTLDFTICNECQQTFLKALDECPNCGSKALTVYSKITGYYVPVYKTDKDGNISRQWNDGKIGEFKERKKYNL